MINKHHRHPTVTMIKQIGHFIAYHFVSRRSNLEISKVDYLVYKIPRSCDRGLLQSTDLKKFTIYIGFSVFFYQLKCRKSRLLSNFFRVCKLDQLVALPNALVTTGRHLRFFQPRSMGLYVGNWFFSISLHNCHFRV